MTYTIYLFDHLFLLTIHVGLKLYVESVTSPIFMTKHLFYYY